MDPDEIAALAHWSTFRSLKNPGETYARGTFVERCRWVLAMSA
jgi:hypothetical protein